MSGGWVDASIEGACNVEYGTRVVQKRDGGTAYPVYGGGGETFRVDAYNREDRVVIARFGMSPDCVRRVRGRFFLNDSGLTLSTRDPNVLAQDYLDYLAFSLKDTIYGLGKGQAQRNLNVPAFRELQISFPKSLAEQKRIVTLLDQALEASDRAEKLCVSNIQNAKHLFQSVLGEAFGIVGAGSSLVTVSDVASHSLGKMLDRSKNRGVLAKYLRNINVRWFRVDCSDLLEMRFEAREKDRYSVKRGDLLICEGGYPGRAAVWEQDEEIYFQKAIHRVRFSKPWLAKWMMYHLHWQDSSGALRRHFSGTGIQHFTGVALAKYPMRIPPDSVGAQVVTKLDAARDEIERLGYAFREKVGGIGSLRGALLSEVSRERSRISQ